MSVVADLGQPALWAVVVLPALVGAVLVLTGGLRPGGGRGPDKGRPGGSGTLHPAGVVSVTTAAATTALAVVVAVARPSVAVPFMVGTDLGLEVDGLAAAVVPTIAAVTLLVLVAATAEIRRARARFHGLMLIFAAAALLTATATTLPALLLAWEVMGAMSYALIGFWWREERRVSAGLTAFVTTLTADLGLYLAAGAALAGGAGLTLADLADGSPGWRDVVAAGVLVAAIGKAAQLPFAFWISRAMEGPSPVSALLHSAAMVAMGGYLLLRTEPLLRSTGWAGPTAAWVGAVTAVALGVVALAQDDLKQLLAASTSAQLGFVVMGAGVGAIGGGAAQLIGHAATKALLFLAAGAWLTAVGTKQLSGLHGVARRWGVLGWSVAIGLLALAGVPPLSLWATKDEVLAGALDVSPWLYAVGLAGAMLSAAYAAKVLLVVWRDHPDPAGGEGVGKRDEVPDWALEREPTGEVGRAAQAPIAVLAVGAAVLGLLALPPLAEPFARAVGEADPVTASTWELMLSAVLAVAVVTATLRWGTLRLPAPVRAWAGPWLWLETIATRLLVRPTEGLARALAWFDDAVLDRAVGATAQATVALARATARLDDSVVDAAVEGAAVRVRRAARLARRPQTGQLHQYYVQAVALVAAGVVLLVVVR